MKNSVAQACVQVDTSTYIARAITYDFLANGIRMSYFRTPKNYSATDYLHSFHEKTAC